MQIHKQITYRYMKRVFVAQCGLEMTSYKLLTEFEESIPGVTELLPRFGDDWPEPFWDGSGIHGRLEGAEHEVERINVVFSFFGNFIFQTT